MFQLAHRGCIGALIVAALACILAGPAHATGYRIAASDTTPPGYGAAEFLLTKPDCPSLAAAWIELQQRRFAGYAHWPVACSGVAPGYGDIPSAPSITITIRRVPMAGGPQETFTFTGSHVSTWEDGQGDQIESIPLARVAILVGSMICAMLGMVMGFRA